MSTDIKALVLDWTEAFNRHDPDGYAAFMHENCVFTNVGTGRRIVGSAAQRDDLADLVKMWGDLRVEVVNLLVDDDSFTKEWIMTGIHVGDMPGLPATGRSFRIVGAGVGHIRDGKIVNLTEYWNLADFLSQVGALPPPAV
jgi:steroid delta-isomerase-like uncharacterized protein